MTSDLILSCRRQPFLVDRQLTSLMYITSAVNRIFEQPASRLSRPPCVHVRMLYACVASASIVVIVSAALTHTNSSCHSSTSLRLRKQMQMHSIVRVMLRMPGIAPLGGFCMPFSTHATTVTVGSANVLRVTRSVDLSTWFATLTVSVDSAGWRTT